MGTTNTTSLCILLLIGVSFSRAFQARLTVGSGYRHHLLSGWRAEKGRTFTSPTPPKPQRRSQDEQLSKQSYPTRSSHRRSKSILPRYSTRFGFLDLDGGYEDVTILSFLPNAEELPPETRTLLRKLTTQYTYGRAMVDYTVTLDDIFGVIEDEYRAWDVPVRINGVEVHSAATNNSNAEDKRGQVLSRLLSFAVLNQIPAELICEVLSSAMIKEEGPLFMVREALANSGWKGVSFPKGLGIRLKKNLQTPGQKAFQPSRFSLKTSATKQKYAKDLLLSASNISAPEKLKTSREEFLRQLTQDEQSVNERDLPRKSQFGKNSGLHFFPEKGTIEKFRAFLKKQTAALSRAGKGGALAYGFLNFALYAGGTIWQWRSITIATNPGTTSAQLFRSQLTKLGRVLGTVYLGSQVTKLPRILLAIALAPSGEKALDVAQKRLKVSENTAFAILTVALISTFISVLAFLTVGSTAASSYPDISSGFDRLRQGGLNAKKDVWA